eukprot:Gb_34226 [translate_table: standard]
MHGSCLELLGMLGMVSLAVALQLAAVTYGVNLFSEPLKDLEDYMVRLLECLRNPGHRLGIVTVCSWFVADGALPLNVRVFVTVCGCCLMLLRGFEVERKTTVGYGEESLACNNRVKIVQGVGADFIVFGRDGFVATLRHFFQSLNGSSCV